MAVNVPGLIAVIIFYVLILAIGLWVARKQKAANNEDLMLAGRSIGIGLGIFTMTGEGLINNQHFKGETVFSTIHVFSLHETNPRFLFGHEKKQYFL